MAASSIRNLILKVFGKQEVPLDRPELDVLDSVLNELNATKYREHGTPCYEVNWECFKIDGQKISIRIEDEMFSYLVGPHMLVEKIRKMIKIKIEPFH